MTNNQMMNVKRMVNNPSAYGIMRTSSAALATKWSYEGKYIKTILLGDDGRFWVMDTNREAGLLIKAGYERA